VSVDPAGGSTARAATATIAAESSSQTGYRAPRAIAASPAITPPPPATAAVQSPNVTSGCGRLSGSSTGSGPVGLGISGTVTLCRADEAATMIRIEAAIPVAATQLRSRVAGLPRGAAAERLRTSALVRDAGASPGGVPACLARLTAPASPPRR
jgi:hypothetical protein